METLTLCVLIICLIQGSMNQVIEFRDGIQVEDSNDLDTYPVNWTSRGKLVLTQKDLILFEPKVMVYKQSELCSIDLRKCASNEQTAVASDLCFCTQQSEEEYQLYVKGQGHLQSDEVTVQAVVPSRFLFSPLAAVQQIGSLPVAAGQKAQHSKLAKRIQELEEALAEKVRAANDLEKDLAAERRVTNALEKANKELEKAANQTRKEHALQTPQTCTDVQDSNPRPVVTLQNGLEVVCDTVTDNGGWIVIQRRASQDVDFYRNWTDYKYGFGDVYGNMWFGLEKVHRLTFKKRYELRIDLAFNGTNYFAHYDNFTVLGEPEMYKLLVSGYSGTAGDSFSLHAHTSPNNMGFSTKDRDNDLSTDNCAVHFHGAWWYQACHSANLNGEWGSKEYARGLSWATITGAYDTATFSELKIRPLSP